MSTKLDEIMESLQAVIKARGLGNFDKDFLEIEIKNAIQAINRCRRFKPTKDVLYDSKYEDLIIPLCISSLAKIGAEGQTSHSENNVQRNYGTDGNYPISILSQIKPLIK